MLVTYIRCRYATYAHADCHAFCCFFAALQPLTLRWFTLRASCFRSFADYCLMPRCFSRADIVAMRRPMFICYAIAALRYIRHYDFR